MKKNMSNLKIVFIGGGSYQWGISLIRDMLVTKGLDGSHMVLMDIDLKAANNVKKAAETTQKRTKTNWTFECTRNRKKALKGADFVILCISTGAFDSMEHDLNIPWKYGIHHTVGDSVGPGGLNRALRNIPVFVDIMNDINIICPDAWTLNVTNPMTTLTSSMAKVSKNGKIIGLCHEVYGGSDFVANMLGIDKKDPSLNIVSAGINHCIWLLKAEYKNKDVIPALKKAVKNKSRTYKKHKDKIKKEDFDNYWKHTRTKRELMSLIGYLPLAGDRHTVENFGCFVNDPKILTDFWGCHYTTIEDRRLRWLPPMKKNTCEIASGKQKIKLACSHEPVAPIIEAIANNKTYCLKAGNLANIGQIPNLPLNAVVETPCIVTGEGITPVCVGNLPPQLAAVITGHCYRQEMIVEAAMTANRQLALEALISDPMLTDASIADNLLTEMMEATAQWLPQFYPKGLKRKTVIKRKTSKTKSNTQRSAPVPKEISDR